SDLESIKCVNQKMRAFAEYRRPRVEKKQMGGLRITPLNPCLVCHVFYLFFEPSSDAFYSYQIFNPVKCALSNKDVMLERRAFHSEICSNQPITKEVSRSFASRPNNNQIPLIFFARLRRLLMNSSI
ncbi:hypothetical protein PFISCL1PPCAC_3061, partial [Pristionchus fissidentatus]